MGWFSKKKEIPPIKTVEELTRPKDTMVKISVVELKQLKEKAHQYDWLITGENGNFLRRNGIIK